MKTGAIVNAAIARSFANADATAKLPDLGADAQTNTTPRELAEAVQRETAKWAGIVKESGAHAE